MTHEEVIIGDARLILGDCRDVLPTLPPLSAVVTDPPYGLSFMGRHWDYDVPPTDLWALVLDRLLPGGHLLAFAGTRTQHRMAVRIEDAGFEIRDMLAWVYGSGFPKSLDVGKAIDKAAGVERAVVAAGSPVKRMIPGADQHRTGSWIKDNGREFVPTVSVPATEAARQWDGWGTALKPAFEPITLARKPLVGTVAQNVQTHGTGGLNIDGCRVAADDKTPAPVGRFVGSKIGPVGLGGERNDRADRLGRWPANLIHDGSDEVVALFPENPVPGNVRSSPKRASIARAWKIGSKGDRGDYIREEPPIGSTARFFYCAKAAASERGAGNDHPTVKPVALMRWLLTLVTPPGGVVLDPFLGSGSTGVAAADLGMRFVGIERERRYFDIACERIARAKAQGTLDLPEPAPRMAQESLL